MPATQLLHFARYTRNGVFVVLLASGSAACERQSTPERQEPVAAEEPRAQRANALNPRNERKQAANERNPNTPGDPASSAAHAPQRPQNPGAAAPSKAKEPSEKQLARFARAYGKVQDLNQDYAKRLSAAPDPEQARALQQEASQAMLTVVEDVGLTAAEYTEIARYLESSPQLRREVLGPTKPN